MNYTEKYHLPQWEENDRVMRTDFNQMCANIESGIDGAKAQAAQSDAALDQKIAAAQSSADTAQQTALDYKHYMTGMYTGDGKKIKITLGFQPSAVLISQMYGTSNPDVTAGTIYLFLLERPLPYLVFEEDGFSVVYQENTYPRVNLPTRQYAYLALR